MIIRLFIIFFLLITLHNSSPAQELNYPELFGDDWKKAETFERENRKWMEPLLTKNHISYPIAIAVIFPELVRYSALRDKMEITLLKALYVNLGQEYSDFSIGQFQMKPSFAENIRDKAPSVMIRKTGITFKKLSEFNNIKNYRKSIVDDLEDPKTQFNYLIAFIKICEKNFKTLRMDDTSRVKFLSTAYNFGFEKDSDQIKEMIPAKYYSTKLYKTDNYSYSDISLFWYSKYMEMKIL